MTSSSGDGLILRVVPHGENDKLVTWYSRQSGRMTALAKGAQKSKKRFSNKLEHFAQLHFHIRPPRSRFGLYFLEEADLVHAHIHIRRNYCRYLAASCIAELILRFTRELDPDSRIYTLLVWAMAAIDREPRVARHPLFFHLKLLHLAGYMPEFSTCHQCGAALVEGGAVCMPARGGEGLLLRCRSCGPAGVRAQEQRLSLQTMRMLHFAQHADTRILDKLQPAPHSVVEALDVLHLYSQYLLQTDLHAWPLLRRQLLAQTPPSPPARVRPRGVSLSASGADSFLDSAGKVV